MTRKEQLEQETDYQDLPGQRYWFKPKQKLLWGIKWELSCAILTKDWERAAKALEQLQRITT